MRSDLDALMLSRNLDALLVIGHAEHNPPMYYFVGGGHVSHAALIKKRGDTPVLFHADMERDEAAKSGLKLMSFSKYEFPTPCSRIQYLVRFSNLPNFYVCLHQHS